MMKHFIHNVYQLAFETMKILFFIVVVPAVSGMLIIKALCKEDPAQYLQSWFETDDLDDPDVWGWVLVTFLSSCMWFITIITLLVV